ncbi:hypothetical protein Tco_1162876 [Tanacetum coccineum]
MFPSRPSLGCDRLVFRAKVIENQVMAALVIYISLDLSDESVRSSFPRVILIGSISVEVPVEPEVGAATVASPARVLELDTHSSSETDPSQSSLPPVSVAPMVSPFLWRSRVASRSSSPTTSTPEILTAPIPPAPPAVIAPYTDIPIGRLYYTHPGGPCRALIARKLVRPLPYHCLALRYTSHNLDHFTSGSSSEHSSSDHSSSGHSISGHFVSEHIPPDTTIANSSTPSRFVYPPLLGLYAGDSSTKSSVGLSCKRCMSPSTTMTSSIHALRALVPSCADLLPPHKRFRDSILLEDSVEEDVDADVLADIEADATAIKVVVGMDVEPRVDAGIGMEVDVRVDVKDEVKDEVESIDRAGCKDIYRHVMEIPLQRVKDIETGQKELVARSLIAGGERASLLDQVASLERSNIMTITSSGMTPEAIEELINQRVAEALATYEANRATKLTVESQSQNGDDDDNGNVGVNGNENGGEMETKTVEEMETEMEEAIGMEIPIGMIEVLCMSPMETVLHISNCPERYQVKYATCTLLNSTLTWWNAHKRIVGADAAFAMSWRELMKLMTKVYCPRNEIQKMESEL